MFKGFLWDLKTAAPTWCVQLNTPECSLVRRPWVQSPCQTWTRTPTPPKEQSLRGKLSCITTLTLRGPHCSVKGKYSSRILAHFCIQRQILESMLWLCCSPQSNCINHCYFLFSSPNRNYWWEQDRLQFCPRPCFRRLCSAACLWLPLWRLSLVTGSRPLRGAELALTCPESECPATTWILVAAACWYPSMWQCNCVSGGPTGFGSPLELR